MAAANDDQTAEDKARADRDVDHARLLVDLQLHQAELEAQNDELRRVQEQLKAAHDSYQDLFTLAPIGYVVLGARGRIMSANVAAAALLGLPREALIGRTFQAFIDPIEAYRFHLHHQQAFREPGIKRSIELRLRREDRQPVEALLEATCYVPPAGGPRLCRVALVDITARRRSERLLQERQARLSAILNTVVDGILTIDDTGIIESVNQGTLRLFGYGESELLGKPIALLMPEPHRSRYRFLLSRYLSHGEESIVGQTREVPARRRDGTIFPAELTIGELRLESERHYVGVLRDVSERKAQDRRVRESLARFQEIADRTEDVFYIAQPSSGGVLYVSPAFERIFGRALDDHGTQPSWLPWVHPDDRERVRAALARAEIRHGIDEEYRIIRPDGGERLLRDRAFPLRQEDRITGILHDVTDERALEAELRHAQRLEAVGTLASGIAHDFNNLLMGLAGLAKMALRALPPEHPGAAFVRRSLESTERGAALTRQLLMFSGHRRTQAVAVELDSACRAARELLHRLVGDHIHLSLQTRAPGLGVLAEPGEIEQILMNLVANSRDAMPDGGELTVTTEAAATGATVLLSVADTGAGMDEKTKSQLFEPFFTTKGVGRGTGLGLSTVFGVARQRGGDVRVDSTLGRGTTVTVSLPVVARDLPGATPAAATPTGDETVLAVEDDPLVRETIDDDLRALGYRVSVVSRPEDARARVAAAPPVDLLLTDVMMPGQLGGDLARDLKRELPALRVLFMSAHPQSDLLRLERIDPGDRLLCKPFDRRELGLAVRAVLDRREDRAGQRGRQEPARGRNALVVDDDPDVAEAMRDALEQAGMPTTVARTGSEAVQVAGDLHPDLILCDLTLGRGLSGYDVARAFRADERHRGSVLVAITGLPSDQCSAAASAAGFDEVLTKPIELAQLEALVERSSHAAGDTGHGRR